MITSEELEAYLFDTGREYTSPETDMWIIQDDETPESIVLYRSPPVITFRVKLMEMPEGDKRSELAERLLWLNANEMVAGAYGLEDNSIVLVDTLQLENLDLNEVQATIDGLSLAVSMHYSELSKYRPPAKETVMDARLTAFDTALGVTQGS